jgi:Cdc6-like AAA superfamily ATPase
MLTPMSRTAFDALIREISKKGVPEFVKYTNNRLANEDRMYSFLVSHFADKCAEQLGPAGFEAARQISAICHRACELAEQYKDSTIQYQMIIDDPTPTVQAIKEAGALINLIMIRSRFNPR